MAQHANRRLAAIVSADVAGYSRLMGADEEGTLGRLKTLRAELVDPKIAEHGGRIVKTTGDGLLLEFSSVVGAVRCVDEIRTAMALRNADLPQDRRIEFRIGVNLGDIIIDGDDIFGDGVNVAARLQESAKPGGICVSSRVHDDVRDRLEIGFDDAGEQSLKNIARPVRIWQWNAGAPSIAATDPAGPALPLPEKPSIAVLPFANMSGDPEQEYFADGIAEDVITLLSKSRGLFVIARNSSFTYKGRAVDVKQVGRELGVRYVLEGGVRKAGNRVRVTGQLIEAATGGHLWAERYDRDLTDIFAVQDEITASVSAAILPTMERSERERAARKPPDNLDAWECYHRGLWHYAKIEAAENARAIAFFERAIELDPGFAAAHAAMARALASEAVRFRPPAERQTLIPRAVEHARRSVALDPADAIGHGALALTLLLTGRHEEAMAEADLSVSLDPNSAPAHGYQGATRAFGGRPRDAIEPLETAMRLSPFDPFRPDWLHYFGRAYYCMGDYPAAVAAARQLCQSYPNYRTAYATLIAGLGQIGQPREAQRVAAEAIDRFGDDYRLCLRGNAAENRVEDSEHLIEGYRKAGVFVE